jgi:hypothetical protein
VRGWEGCEEVTGEVGGGSAAPEKIPHLHFTNEVSVNLSKFKTFSHFSHFSHFSFFSNSKKTEKTEKTENHIKNIGRWGWRQRKLPGKMLSFCCDNVWRTCFAERIFAHWSLCHF